MKTYQCVSVIEGVDCYCSNSFEEVDKDRVIIGHKNGFGVINIEKCIIEKAVKDEEIEFVSCIIKLRDNTILCGCNKGILCVYNKDTLRYMIVKTNHVKIISHLLCIDEHSFMTSSEDQLLKVWSY